MGSLLDALFKDDQAQQMSVLHEYATGHIMTELPVELADTLKRYATIAEIMVKFLNTLQKNKSTPYPEKELRAACITAGLIDIEKEKQETVDIGKMAQVIRMFPVESRKGEFMSKWPNKKQIDEALTEMDSVLASKPLSVHASPVDRFKHSLCSQFVVYMNAHIDSRP